MPKRSTKFYRKNEAEVMERLGLNPTKNSGAGWVEKEDGQNEHFICQLKSTDNQSISIKQNDIHVLENNAAVSHKTPIFAFQFLNTNEVWVAISEDEFKAYTAFKEQQQEKEICKGIDLALDESDQTSYNIFVASRNAGRSYLARQEFLKQREKEREQQKEDFKNIMKERRKQVGEEIQAKRNSNI